MVYTFKDLKHMTVAQLRDIAAGMKEEKVKGYTQLNKEHLLAAICEVLHIEMHEHHEVVGVDKNTIKLKIRALKKNRDEAIHKKDYVALKSIRNQIKKFKKQLRQAAI